VTTLPGQALLRLTGRSIEEFDREIPMARCGDEASIGAERQDGRIVVFVGNDLGATRLAARWNTDFNYLLLLAYF
jgi:hypothetical protein